jgi:hypothetical protein
LEFDGPRRRARLGIQAEGVFAEVAHAVVVVVGFRAGEPGGVGPCGVVGCSATARRKRTRIFPSMFSGAPLAVSGGDGFLRISPKIPPKSQDCPDPDLAA